MSRMLQALRQLEAKSESFAPAVADEPPSEPLASWASVDVAPEAIDGWESAKTMLADTLEGDVPAAEETPGDALSPMETAEAALERFDGLTALLGRSASLQSTELTPPEPELPPPEPEPAAVGESTPLEAAIESGPAVTEPVFIELPQPPATEFLPTEVFDPAAQEPAMAEAAAFDSKDADFAELWTPVPSAAVEPISTSPDVEPISSPAEVEPASAPAEVEPIPPAKARDARPASTPARAVAPLERAVTEADRKGPLWRQVEDFAGAVASQFAAATTAAVLLVGADAGDHAALVTAHLGAALARREAGDILLVDANAASRALSVGLGLNGCAGLAELLADASDHQGPAVHASASLGVSILPAGRSGLLGAMDLDHHVALLLRELGRRQRWILVHGAAESSLTRAFCRACDGAFLIVRLGQTRPEQAQQTLEALGASGAHILGCIATNAPA
jgi:Mrp family chromosome partitioning ATPase